jgi:hypothetical protein
VFLSISQNREIVKGITNIPAIDYALYKENLKKVK